MPRKRKIGKKRGKRRGRKDKNSGKKERKNVKRNVKKNARRKRRKNGKRKKNENDRKSVKKTDGGVGPDPSLVEDTQEAEAEIDARVGIEAETGEDRAAEVIGHVAGKGGGVVTGGEGLAAVIVVTVNAPGVETGSDHVVGTGHVAVVMAAVIGQVEIVTVTVAVRAAEGQEVETKKIDDRLNMRKNQGRENQEVKRTWMFTTNPASIPRMNQTRPNQR